MESEQREERLTRGHYISGNDIYFVEETCFGNVATNFEKRKYILRRTDSGNPELSELEREAGFRGILDPSLLKPVPSNNGGKGIEESLFPFAFFDAKLERLF